MPRRDAWWRFLARVLPWFDTEAYDRDRLATLRTLQRAERVLAEVARVERVIRGAR